MSTQRTSIGDFRELATDLQFPEGPIAMADGSVLLTEIRRGTLSRVPAGGGDAEVVAELGGGPNGTAIGPDGAVYVVNNGGFSWSEIGEMILPFDLTDMSNQPSDFEGGWVERVDLSTGEHSVLYREHDGHHFRGPNDIVFDAEGGFWFTDFGKIRAHDTDRGSLFYATSDGKRLTRAAHGLYGPNGVGLSPSGDRVYVAESFTGRLLAWDVSAPGAVAGGPTVVEATKGHFDSLAVEADGTIVVAAINDGLCVVQADGSGHEYVAVPADGFVTNVCFGGDDLKTAYITGSGTGKLLACDWPRPGLRLQH